MSTPSPSPSAATDTKRFISAEGLSHLAEELAFQVAVDDFKPTFIIALWRGGCAPGAVVQEFLERAQKTKIDHVAVRTVSRDPVTGAPLSAMLVHAVGHALHTLTRSSRLLIVDDVWDSGRTAVGLKSFLLGELGDCMPEETKVATIFYKPTRNTTNREPDYYVEATDDWLVFPHELVELSDAEVQEFRPHAYGLLKILESVTK